MRNYSGQIYYPQFLVYLVYLHDPDMAVCEAAILFLHVMRLSPQFPKTMMKSCFRGSDAWSVPDARGNCTPDCCTLG